MRQRRGVGEQRFELLEARHRAVQRQPSHRIDVACVACVANVAGLASVVRGTARQRRQQRTEGRIGDHRAGIAVLHQVAQLGRGQRGGHRRQVQPGTPCAPGRGQAFGPVAEQRRDVVAAHQAELPEHGRETVRQRFEFAVAQALIAAHDGHALWRGACLPPQVPDRVHGRAYRRAYRSAYRSAHCHPCGRQPTLRCALSWSLRPRTSD